MKKIIKITNIISLIFISSLLSLYSIEFISEKYFFDKLYYNKSIKHGYWNPEKTTKFSEFGNRSRDIDNLYKEWEKKKENNTLGKTTIPDDQFIIAIHGDSYVWGQGVKYTNTLPYLLEKNLNKQINSTVLGLAISGNSIMELQNSYYLANNVYSVDFNIFVPVTNDLLIKNEVNYEKKYPQWNICKKKHPDINPIYDWTEEEQSGTTDKENLNDHYKKIVNLSWENDFNLCLLDESLKTISNKNSIFFIPLCYEDNNMNKYTKYIKNHNFQIANFLDSENNDKYESFWKDPLYNFMVSEQDGHPSKHAHLIFAQMLEPIVLEKIHQN